MGSASSHPELRAESPAVQIREGVLFKQSETIKAWNARFCRLENRVLQYWDDEAMMRSGQAARGVISLENCGVSRAVTDDGSPALCIETPRDAKRMAAQRSQTRMMFQAKTLTELTYWVRALQLASREPWQRDEAVETCPLCRLVGFDALKRKHHCRRCGTVVCELCSPAKEPLPLYAYDAPVRVCRDCAGQPGPVPTAAERAERAARAEEEKERAADAARASAVRETKDKRAVDAEERKARIRADIARRTSGVGGATAGGR